MATDFSSELKKIAKRKIVTSFLGTGMVGRAVTKRFVGEEESGNPVKEALDEQTNIQAEINATIVRLESVVTNIADNVYNIAAVWSERVTSMKEAKRLQEERISKEQAALEEAENEAARMIAPLPSATNGSDLMNQRDVTEKGLLGKLAESVGGMRRILSLLTTKVGLIAAGLAAAGVAVAGVAVNNMLQDVNQRDAGPQMTPEQQQAFDSLQSNFEEPPPSDLGSLVGEMVGGPQVLGGLSPSSPAPLTSTGGISQGLVPTAGGSGALSGAIPAGAPNVGGTSGGAGTSQSMAGGLTPTPDNADPAANGGLSPAPGGGAGAPAVTTSQPSISGSAMTGATGASGAAAGGGQSSESPVNISGGMSPASSAVSGATGGLSGAEASATVPASLETNVPSTGAAISSMSVPAMPSSGGEGAPEVVVQNNQTMGGRQESPPLPSPVADRGSLDIGVYFRAAPADSMMGMI